VFVLIVWSVIGLAMAAVGAPVPLRIALVAPVVLFVPGWLTLRIIVVGWTRFETFVGAVVVSLCEIVFVGFFLYFIGALRSSGWILSITALMAVLLLIKPLQMTRVVDFLVWFPRPPERLIAYLTGTTLLVGLAFTLAIKDAEVDRPYEILELWIVSNPTNSVSIGIANGDNTDRNFRLELRGQARTIKVLENVQVKAQSTFTVSIETGPSPAKEERVQAVLLDLAGRTLRRASTTLYPSQISQPAPEPLPDQRSLELWHRAK
jgi:hypothetical protein